MGACFDEFTAKTNDRDEAVKLCYDYISDCKWDFGHAGYTGTFAECDGVQILSKEFASESDAYDWLIDNAEKWGPALGVKINPLEGDHYYYFGAGCSS